jgi:O-acetyl-ADP-ribose deacetylase (regulator of RNase III)
MAVTLQNALTHHQALLGENFEHLGKKNWVYLTYDDVAGWGAVKYEGCAGYFQAFLRYIGLAWWTTLSTVAHQIQREANVPPALLAKINGSWQRQGHQIPAPVAAPIAPPVAAPIAPPVAAPAAVNRVSINVGATRVTIEQVDITQVQGVKAIINAANPACLGGGGIDGAIHRAAGPDLLAACQALPVIAPNVRCNTGGAVITASGNLAQIGIDHVIHTVGPVYNAANPRESADLLRQAYTSCLDIAHANGIQTLAIPAISTGIFGYPFDDATQISLEVVANYAHRNPGRFTEIKLVHMGPRAAEAARILNQLQHPHAV